MNNIETTYEVVKPKRLTKKISIKTIEKLVCKYFEINQHQLLCRCRKREFIENKQLFHYLAHLYTNESLSSIGRYRYYNYSHSSILNSIEKVENMIDTEPEFRQTVHKLKERIRAIQLTLILNETNVKQLTSDISKDILMCSDVKEIQSILLKYIVKI